VQSQRHAIERTQSTHDASERANLWTIGIATNIEGEWYRGVPEDKSIIRCTKNRKSLCDVVYIVLEHLLSDYDSTLQNIGRANFSFLNYLITVSVDCLQCAHRNH